MVYSPAFEPRRLQLQSGTKIQLDDIDKDQLFFSNSNNPDDEETKLTYNGRSAQQGLQDLFTTPATFQSQYTIFPWSRPYMAFRPIQDLSELPDDENPVVTTLSNRLSNTSSDSYVGIQQSFGTPPRLRTSLRFHASECRECAFSRKGHSANRTMCSQSYTLFECGCMKKHEIEPAPCEKRLEKGECDCDADFWRTNWKLNQICGHCRKVKAEKKRDSGPRNLW